MAASARSSMDLSVPSKRYLNYYDTDRKSSTSPDKMNIWVEPKTKGGSGSDGKVDVVYYISKNGDLQHPHFMEVFLSSAHGLYLRGTSLITLLQFRIFACMCVHARVCACCIVVHL